MQADAFDFEVAAIEPETCVCIEVKFTDAEGYRLVINSGSADAPLSCAAELVFTMWD